MAQPDAAHPALDPVAAAAARAYIATTTTTITGGRPPFEFPPFYYFPPFFTIQPNLNTRKAQMHKWSALVRDYCRHHRVFRLRLSGPPADTELFCNPARDRQLNPEGVRMVVDFMRAEGTAEYCHGGGGGGGDGNSSSGIGGGGATGAVQGGAGDEVWIYWRTPAEWAGMIDGWVDATGQKGCVLTLHELSEGDSTLGTEFHGLDPELLMKALGVLVKRGKAQVFGKEDSRGVKFF